MKITSIKPAEGSKFFNENSRRLEYQSAWDGSDDWAIVERNPGANGNVWVVVLHGHGSGGDQLFSRQDLANFILPAIRERGLSILSPNLRGNDWMSGASVADLHGLIAWAREEYPGSRFVLDAGSMGGTGALIYAINWPDEIEGVSARCPATDIGRYWFHCRDNPLQKPVVTAIREAIEKAYGGTPQEVPGAYEAHSALLHAARFSMPLYLVHGNADDLIPVEESRSLVVELKKLGKNYFYYEIPEGNHDAPIAEAVRGLDWVLEQSSNG